VKTLTKTVNDLTCTNTCALQYVLVYVIVNSFINNNYDQWIRFTNVTYGMD